MKGFHTPPIVVVAIAAAFAFYGLPLASASDTDTRTTLSWGTIVAAAIAGAGVTFAGRSDDYENDRTREAVLTGRLLIALGIGLAVGIHAVDRLPPPPSLGFMPQSVVSIVGRITADPRKLESGSSLVSMELHSAKDGAGRIATAEGKLSVFVPEAPAKGIREQGKGAVVALTGSVADSLGGRVFRAGSAEIISGPNRIEGLRNAALAEAVRRFDRVRWGGLAAALLLGVRDGLDHGEGDLYAKSGCAHVLSLSGMHLAVISALVALALKKPLGLRVSAVAGTAFVAVYVLFVGFQPALIRSVIMYFLGAVAILGGYPRRVLPLLAAAFLVQLSLDAESARSLSFQLSYLALFGIVTLGGVLDDLSKGMLPGPLRVSISTSVGAFLATAAVCAAAFGSLRPVGILASIAAAPAATALMIGALAWFALDIVAPPAAACLEPLVGMTAEAGNSVILIASRVEGLESPQASVVLFASLATSSLLVYGRYRLNQTRNRVDPFD